MIKFTLMLISFMALTGCSTDYPSVSDKSNAMLQDEQWKPINTENIKGHI